jgi:hypothetical protein
MRLPEYHRLRREEEESWDRARLRAEAGRDPVSAFHCAVIGGEIPVRAIFEP